MRRRYCVVDVTTNHRSTFEQTSTALEVNFTFFIKKTRLFQGLTEINFDLNYNTPSLNQWTVSALQLSGVWEPASSPRATMTQPSGTRTTTNITICFRAYDVWDESVSFTFLNVRLGYQHHWYQNSWNRASSPMGNKARLNKLPKTKQREKTTSWEFLRVHNSKIDLEPLTNQ